MATSTILMAGAAASGAVVLWPASAAARSTAAASPVPRSLESGHAGTKQVQPSLDSVTAQQLRLTVLDAQRTILAVDAKKAAAKRMAAARAAHAAALMAARQQAEQQQAAQQAAQQATQPQPAVSSAPSGSPQQVAMGMLASFGWSSSQFSCLDELWSHESGWSITAANPSSGAYGIPQALPGSKMASAGPDWQTDAATQIRWGLGYIEGSYGSPCGAWAHEESVGWY
jgi:hypothetical protein